MSAEKIGCGESLDATIKQTSKTMVPHQISECQVFGQSFGPGGIQPAKSTNISQVVGGYNLGQSVGAGDMQSAKPTKPKSFFSDKNPKEKSFMSLACVISMDDCKYLAADGLVSSYIDNKKTFSTQEKAFVFSNPSSNPTVGCVFTGQLTFGKERVPVSQIAKGINAQTAEEAAEKLNHVLSAYGFVDYVFAYIADADHCLSLFTEKDPDTNVLTSKISDITDSVKESVYFAGVDWARAYALNFQIDRMNSENQPEQILRIYHTIISMDRQLPINSRSIDYPVSIIKITKDGAKIQTYLG